MDEHAKNSAGVLTKHVFCMFNLGTSIRTR